MTYWLYHVESCSIPIKYPYILYCGLRIPIVSYLWTSMNNKTNNRWSITVTSYNWLPWINNDPIIVIITSRLSTGNNHGQIWEILAISNHDYFQPWLQNGQFRKKKKNIMFSRQDLGRFQKRSEWCHSPSVQHSPITSGVTLGLLILVGNHSHDQLLSYFGLWSLIKKNDNAINP